MIQNQPCPGIFAATETPHGHVKLVRRSGKKKRWQLRFALVQFQTESSWLEKEEHQFTLTHHHLFSAGTRFQWPPNDSPVSRSCFLSSARWSVECSETFMSLALVLVQWCDCTVKGEDGPWLHMLKSYPYTWNTYPKGVWMPSARSL